jgi:hypothetical protein
VTILIESPGQARGEFDAERELQRAFDALHCTDIRVLGGGRFLDGSGYVVLACEADGPAALVALVQAGIKASELKPRTELEARKSVPHRRTWPFV